MKLLWLCNIPSSDISQDLNMDTPYVGGWIASLYHQIIKSDAIDITYVFPLGINQEAKGRALVDYYGFSLLKGKQTKYDPALEEKFFLYIKEAKPNVIHIFGTELPHTLAMVNAAKRADLSDHLIISIQGLVSVCAQHYTQGLSRKVVNAWTFRDFLRMDNIHHQQKAFEKRGKFEIEAIKSIKHVIGRTTWDNACVHQINPKIQYHYINESLRDGFYTHNWSLKSCKRHSIFLSSAEYPIKGAHYMINALPKIIERFADAHVYISGVTLKNTSFKSRLRITAYHKYILRLIKANKLSAHVTFLGPLDESAMIEAYLKAHVFVCSSVIENSPNSLGEAMLLGVPSVSANVGGVSDLMAHGKEGFLYHSTADYMLAHYINQIFANDDLANKLSKKAHEHAIKTHNQKENTNDTLEFYKKVAKTVK